jgi:hypothetical protein
MNASKQGGTAGTPVPHEIVDFMRDGSFFIFRKPLLLLNEVDFRSRMLAFRGACGEPPLRSAPIGVSPVTLVPQDKEGNGRDTSHEENLKFNFRGVSHLALQPTYR